MKKCSFWVGIVVFFLAFFSCSKEEIQLLHIEENQDSRVIDQCVESQCVTVNEFVELVASDCKDYELEFLMGLPQDMKVYVFPKGCKNYHTLKPNEIKDLLSLMNSKSKKTSQLNTEITDAMIVKTLPVSRIYTEPRSVQNVPIYSVAIFPFGDIFVNATFNYIYAVDAHIITEAGSVVCDINDEWYIGEYVFDWVDKGSSAVVSEDEIGLLYNVNGDIVLPTYINNFPAGFVCHAVRGVCGELVVPYE